MKPESLDALLTDHCLGELTPEAAELLQEHLARDPAAAQRAQELEATLAWARKATAITLERPERPLAAVAVAPAPPPSRLRVTWAEGLRLAACVVLGLAAGWWANGARGPSTSVASAPTLPLETRPGGARDQGPAFWSVANLSQHQRPRAPAGRNREDVFQIPWESIVK